MSNYKGIVCRCSLALGTACKKCERCIDEMGKAYVPPITPEQAQRTLDVLGYFECMCEDCKEVTPIITKALEHFAGGRND